LRFSVLVLLWSCNLMLGKVINIPNTGLYTIKEEVSF
jgi:hypothetical protein